LGTRIYRENIITPLGYSITASLLEPERERILATLMVSIANVLAK
jgi:hypothetical protein